MSNSTDWSAKCDPLGDLLRFHDECMAAINKPMERPAAVYHILEFEVLIRRFDFDLEAIEIFVMCQDGKLMSLG